MAARPFERFEDPPYDRSFGGVWIDGNPPCRVSSWAWSGDRRRPAAALYARAPCGRVTTVPVGHTWGELEVLTHRLTRDRAALRRLGVELVEWGPKLGRTLAPRSAQSRAGSSSSGCTATRRRWRAPS